MESITYWFCNAALTLICVLHQLTVLDVELKKKQRPKYQLFRQVCNEHATCCWQLTATEDRSQNTVELQTIFPKMPLGNMPFEG